MADEPVALPESSSRRPIPWLRLFRGVGLAADPKALLLAVLGLLALQLGWGALDRAFSVGIPMAPDALRAARPRLPAGVAELESRIRPSFRTMTEPFQVVVGPFLRVFDPTNDSRTALHALLAGIWALAVWSAVGGAIARVALARVVRGERLGMRGSLRFARRQAVALVGAPLGPLVGVVLCAAFCAAFGAIFYRLPGAIGPRVAGILAFLPLLAGLAMTLILAGLAAGWPLMPASVAAEAEDGFDAVSRAYAYVRQRPWRYGAYVALAWTIGSVGSIVVDLFAALVIHLTYWGLSFGAPGPGRLDTLFGGADMPIDPTARSFHSFWFAVIGLLAYGWVYSYFWTAMAQIYLLLRHDVDGTPWHVLAPGVGTAPAIVAVPVLTEEGEVGVGPTAVG